MYKYVHLLWKNKKILKICFDDTVKKVKKEKTKRDWKQRKLF